jgi:hypothetical protein
MTLPGRQSATAGKVLRKIISPSAFTGEIVINNGAGGTECARIAPITDADVEQLVVYLQSKFRPIDPFIVTGEAIRYWYFETNYTEIGPRNLLHQSCMRYATCWGDIRFYAQNPKVCAMLCLLGTDGKLAARALLWNGPTGILMDRVYGTNQHQRAFRQFADKRGWSYRVSDEVDRKGLKDDAFFALPLQQLHVNQRPPYLDTFDLVPFHATGDRAAAQDNAGRTVGHSDLTEPWLVDPKVNPISYAAITTKHGAWPHGHPLQKRRPRDRDDEAMRNVRVDYLSDFSWIKPWPEDLIRADPAWTLEHMGSEPEDDAKNAETFPERRTEALVVVRPEPVKVPWSPGELTDGVDAESFRRTLVAMDQAFRQARRVEVGNGPGVVDFVERPQYHEPVIPVRVPAAWRPGRMNPMVNEPREEGPQFFHPLNVRDNP